MARVVPIVKFPDSLNGKENCEKEDEDEIEHGTESEDDEDIFLSISIDFGTT